MMTGVLVLNLSGSTLTLEDEVGPLRRFPAQVRRKLGVLTFPLFEALRDVDLYRRRPEQAAAQVAWDVGWWSLGLEKIRK